MPYHAMQLISAEVSRLPEDAEDFPVRVELGHLMVVMGAPG